MEPTMERISQALADKKISQKQFMADLGLATATYTEWKAGRLKSYKKYIEKIADYLDVSVDYLLGRSEDITVVDRIFRIMQDKGLTAADVSKQTGISAGNFTDWKKGRAKPGAKAIERLAQFFGVSVDYLLGRLDDCPERTIPAGYIGPLTLEEERWLKAVLAAYRAQKK